MLAVGAGGGCLESFTLVYSISPLSPSLWETAKYRPKYCLKGQLKLKTTNQPTLKIIFLSPEWYGKPYWKYLKGGSSVAVLLT